MRIPSPHAFCVCKHTIGMVLLVLAVPLPSCRRTSVDIGVSSDASADGLRYDGAEDAATMDDPDGAASSPPDAAQVRLPFETQRRVGSKRVTFGELVLGGLSEVDAKVYGGTIASELDCLGVAPMSGIHADVVRMYDIPDLAVPLTPTLITVTHSVRGAEVVAEARDRAIGEGVARCDPKVPRPVRLASQRIADEVWRRIDECLDRQGMWAKRGTTSALGRGCNDGGAVLLEAKRGTQYRVSLVRSCGIPVKERVFVDCVAEIETVARDVVFAVSKDDDAPR